MKKLAMMKNLLGAINNTSADSHFSEIGEGRKRVRRARASEGDSELNALPETVSEDMDTLNDSNTNNASNYVDPRLFNVQFPKQYEHKFAAAIFELGLRNSSPKLIIPLMPPDSDLNTEHIKSHLQKYRVHKQRSKEEFLQFYTSFISHEFDKWEEERGWEGMEQTNNAGQMSSSQIVSYSASSNELNDAQNVELANSSGERAQQASDPSPFLQLERKLKELSQLQEMLQETNSKIEQWKELSGEIQKHSRILAEDLQSLQTRSSLR